MTTAGLLIMAVAIISTYTPSFTDAFFSQFVSRSKMSSGTVQLIRLSDSNAQWSPHSSLGEANIKAFAIQKAEQEAIRLVALAKLEAAEIAKAQAAAAILEEIAAKAQKEAEDRKSVV